MSTSSTFLIFFWLCRHTTPINRRCKLHSQTKSSHKQVWTPTPKIQDLGLSIVHSTLSYFTLNYILYTSSFNPLLSFILLLWKFLIVRVTTIVIYFTRLENSYILIILYVLDLYARLFNGFYFHIKLSHYTAFLTYIPPILYTSQSHTNLFTSTRTLNSISSLF